MQLAVIEVTSCQITPQLLKYFSEVQPFVRKLSCKPQWADRSFVPPRILYLERGYAFFTVQALSLSNLDQ
jgi:hypothetical protein